MTRARGSGPSPSGFFALRTPLLPFDAFESWCAGLASPRAAETGASLEEALQADHALQRRRLRDLVETPAFREALFLASPDLHDSLDAWMSCPEGERGQRVERALVKYFARAAGRATPFGLFAGVSVGRTGGATRLEIEGRESCGRHSRLDMDFLFALRDALARDPARRGGLVFRPNSSLYESVGRLRYVESRLKGEERTYHLVALESSPALRDTLARAAEGARAAELAAALVDSEASREECRAFIDELIDAQVLVPDVGLVVTGGEPTRSMAERLAGGEAAADVAASLVFAEEALGSIDAGGLGADPSRYREIAARLETLPAKPVLHHLVQVDLVKRSPAAALGDAALGEIVKGVELARRLHPTARADELSAFRDAFRERYETREVPLVDVLDEDAGIGFPAYRSDTDGPSPLLDGLPDPAAGDETTPWGRREKTLLGMLGECLAAGAQEIRLGPKEIEALAAESPPPLPGAFAVMARIASAADGGSGFQVVLESLAGPSCAGTRSPISAAPEPRPGDASP